MNLEVGMRGRLLDTCGRAHSGGKGEQDEWTKTRPVARFSELSPLPGSSAGPSAWDIPPKARLVKGQKTKDANQAIISG